MQMMKVSKFHRMSLVSPYNEDSSVVDMTSSFRALISQSGLATRVEASRNDDRNLDNDVVVLDIDELVRTNRDISGFMTSNNVRSHNVYLSMRSYEQKEMVK